MPHRQSERGGRMRPAMPGPGEACELDPPPGSQVVRLTDSPSSSGACVTVR
jgi:hypothetical protein